MRLRMQLSARDLHLLLINRECKCNRCCPPDSTKPDDALAASRVLCAPRLAAPAACTELRIPDRLIMQVPLKYANRSVTGLEYLVSFGAGAALVTSAAAAAYSAAAHRLAW